jgi:peptidoglycan-associated lipoprotein
MKAVSKIFILFLVIQFLGACAQFQRQPPAPPQEPVDTGPAPIPVPVPSPQDTFDADAAAPRQRLIFFDFDSSEVRAESRPVVEAHAGFLLANPGTVAILEGHTDSQGSREYNIALGERRGNSVRRLMIGFGVPRSQLRVVSYGEEMPLAFGDDESAYSENRRVRISY